MVRRRWLAGLIITVLVVLFTTPLSAELPVTCTGLASRWNAFAADANTYIQQLDTIHDVRLRARVEREFAAVTKSDCW